MNYADIKPATDKEVEWVKNFLKAAPFGVSPIALSVPDLKVAKLLKRLHRAEKKLAYQMALYEANHG